MVSLSYDLYEDETVYEKVKFVQTSMVSYKTRLQADIFVISILL